MFPWNQYELTAVQHPYAVLMQLVSMCGFFLCICVSVVVILRLGVRINIILCVFSLPVLVQ